VPEALEITKTFLDTGFEGGRHQRRLDKISGIECSFLDNK
jgi:ribose 5-phosphate isomerase B